MDIKKKIIGVGILGVISLVVALSSLNSNAQNKEDNKPNIESADKTISTEDDIINEDNQLKEVVLENNEGTYKEKVDQLVLAIGHSARKTYEMLYQKQLEISQKAFAVGMRIEHSQEFINKSQYGKFYDHPALKAADYKLAVHTSQKRGVYTFCMCPGGYVMNAASEEKRLVVNGMSNYKRDNKYANSAVLVNVTPDDFGSSHPLAGMYFQRKLEEKAFELGGSDYSIPVQKVEDYLENKEGIENILNK